MQIPDLLYTPAGMALSLLVILLLPFIIKAILWRLFFFDKRLKKILHQTKSSEVKVGKIVETLAPLMQDFPVDVDKAGTSTVFIGQPIDFIHFDPEEGVTLIEVKSGDAQLSATQRKLKKLALEGKVHWAEYRLKG